MLDTHAILARQIIAQRARMSIVNLTMRFADPFGRVIQRRPICMIFFARAQSFIACAAVELLRAQRSAVQLIPPYLNKAISCKTTKPRVWYNIKAKEVDL